MADRERKPIDLEGWRGVPGRARRGRPASGGQPAAEAPWQTDHAWDRRQIRDHDLRRATRAVVVGVLLVILLVPMHQVTVGRAGAGGTLGAVASSANLLLVAGLLWCLCLVARVSRQGRARLVLPRFPFFLGERLEVGLCLGSDVAAFAVLRVAVRLIEERVEGRAVVSRDQLWADTMTIDAPHALHRPGGVIPLAFALPADQPPNALSGDPVRYWLMEVVGETTRVELCARFLLPVYARSPIAETTTVATPVVAADAQVGAARG